MRSGIKMILKRSTLQDFDHTIHVLSLFMFEMTHHLRWGSFQWCDIAYVALTRRSGGWLMIGGGWRYRGNWHLTRLAHSSSLPLACVHCILYIVLYTARTHQPGSSLCSTQCVRWTLYIVQDHSVFTHTCTVECSVNNLCTHCIMHINMARTQQPGSSLCTLSSYCALHALMAPSRPLGSIRNFCNVSEILTDYVGGSQVQFLN